MYKWGKEHQNTLIDKVTYSGKHVGLEQMKILNAYLGMNFKMLNKIATSVREGYKTKKFKNPGRDKMRTSRK